MPITYSSRNDYINHVSGFRRDWIAESTVARFTSGEYGFTIDPAGAMRWDSNGAVPPRDIVELAHFMGLLTDEQFHASNEARDADITATLTAYAERQKELAARGEWPSEEMRFEARAAHGPGVKVVDIVSGLSFIT